MTVVYLCLLIAAALLFLMSGLGVVHNRVNLMALGLFFWVLVSLLQVAQKT